MRVVEGDGEVVNVEVGEGETVYVGVSEVGTLVELSKTKREVVGEFDCIEGDCQIFEVDWQVKAEIINIRTAKRDRKLIGV